MIHTQTRFCSTKKYDPGQHCAIPLQPLYMGKDGLGLCYTDPGKREGREVQP